MLDLHDVIPRLAVTSAHGLFHGENMYICLMPPRSILLCLVYAILSCN